MRIGLLILLIVELGVVVGQSNDDCNNAIAIEDVENFCSTAGAYTTVGSSVSGSDCFSTSSGDVWFTFRSISSSINIRALGAVVDDFRLGAWTKGTMVDPRIALYRGTCNNLVEIECNDSPRSSIGDIFRDDLTPNVQHYIKISAARAGTFQLCISSFDLIPAPQNDCAESVILCTKESFFAPYLRGGGTDPDEIDNSCLDRYNDGGPFNINAESATAWYKWVIRNTGDLTFVITPNNPSDDIDFALMRVNDISDCQNKEVIRCMASGANINDNLSNWIDCHGPTGLLLRDPDVFEEVAGCQNGDNNFVMHVEVVEGETYALVVDNFSNSQHGFSLEFGGTAEFVAPEPSFEIADTLLCIGQSVELIDRSVGITNLMWMFGDGATPADNFGDPQPEIRYSTPGEKTISLIVEGTTGCFTTLQKDLVVMEPFTVDSAVRAQSCPELLNGQIEVFDPGVGPAFTDISWSTGDSTFLIDNLAAGQYTATVTNAENCRHDFQFFVPEPMEIMVEPVVVESTCGESNGSIALSIEGQSQPFEVDFGSGFTSDLSASDLAAGLYTTVVRDAGGCLDSLTLAISDRDLQVDFSFESPSCYGFINGSVTANVLVGNEPIMFDWNLQDMFTSEDMLTSLGAGVVQVEVRDSRLCRRFASVEVTQPDSLVVGLDTTDVSCFGFDNGQLAVGVEGGTGVYTYNWSNGLGASEIEDLAPGRYVVTVTDENMCQVSASAVILEPPPIGLNVADFGNVVCFGDATGTIDVMPAGGSPPYEFSINGRDFQSSMSFPDLAAGLYILTLRDANGCLDSISQTITQPPEWLVQAEGDTTIRLGHRAHLTSQFSPDQEVTYSWSPPEFTDCVDCAATSVIPVRSTNFILTLTNADGCMVSDAVTVNVILDRQVYIPNAITPNGDGRNDRMGIFAGPSAVSVRSMQIFDRWGEMVFKGSNLPVNDPRHGWDGTYRGEKLNPGVFVYLVEVDFIDSETRTFTGDLNLIH